MSVSSGRVAASLPGDPAQQIVEARYQAHIGSGCVSRIQTTNPASVAWMDGIVAERLSLGDFVAQLARYRSGVLGCDPLAQMALFAQQLVYQFALQVGNG